MCLSNTSALASHQHSRVSIRKAPCVKYKVGRQCQFSQDLIRRPHHFFFFTGPFCIRIASRNTEPLIQSSRSGSRSLATR